jgi:2,3-bisphosphoglycerate-dependent phosphoglycerate mutase
VIVQVIGHPSQLWLVRHAQSAGNVANDAALASGLHELDLAIRDMDVPLSELGERQAAALATWLGGLDEPPDVVWCSPYRRALDTARIALDGAGLRVPVVCDERLREREFGVLDRLTKAGIEARHPDQAAARAFLGKFFHRPPGGESWADVAARVRSLLTDLRLDHARERVMVVAHQAVITVARYVLESMSEEQVLAEDKAAEIANTAVTTYAGDGTAMPSLVSFNVSDHLPDELTTEAPDVPAAPRG